MLFLYCYLLYITLGPPNITYYSNEQITFEGNKVIIKCNATNDRNAINPVKISWYNGTQLVKSNGKCVIIYNKHDAVTDQIYSVLTLGSVNITDDGEYICRAFNNPLCYTENKINLTVECEFVGSNCSKFIASKPNNCMCIASYICVQHITHSYSTSVYVDILHNYMYICRCSQDCYCSFTITIYGHSWCKTILVLHS